jgi:PKD repeat protein
VWKWGDGTPDGSGATATHVFIVEGLHSVGLYVTDSDGQTAAVGHGITVGDELPAVSYSPSTYTPHAGQTVTFTGSASDPDGSITSYVWKWGDGTPDGSGATATHVFTVEGLHSVGLYVTDSGGQTAAVGHGITVGDELPAVAYTPSTYTPTVGQTVTFTATASDPDGSITSYVWKWGDGTPDGSGATATHSFATPGLRSVGVYVTDSAGQTNAAGHGITVTGGAGGL